GAGAEPAAPARERQGVRDPVRAGHRDVLARRVHGRPRLEVRVEVPQLAHVVRDGDLADLRQPELRPGVEQPGIHVQPGGVDHARPGRNRHVRPRGDDFPVLDHDRAHVRRARHRVHRPAADRQRLLRGSDGRPEQQRRGTQDTATQCSHRSTSWSVAAPPAASVTTRVSPPRPGRCLRISASFSARIAACRSRSSSMSKYSLPSTYVFCTTPCMLSGCPFQTTRSASFPTSIEPTRSWMRSWIAGFSVTSLSASVSERPPHFIVLAASWLRWRISSASSELIETTTPRSVISAALYGIASYASTLYAHQSENVDAPAPWAAISSATL